jgi:SAM-dependent methyltransferase
MADQAEQPVTRYDRIGTTYTATRAPDPRIEAAIRAALGGAKSVVNVGAGTGAYEPADLDVVAVEPSLTMIEKRTAPAVQGVAEALPLADGSVDAALAVSTLHHWNDVPRGLAELRRVARQRIVIFTWDIAFAGRFWLTRDYLPEIDEWTVGRLPSIAEVEDVLGPLERRPVPVPRECRDGFLRAFWARPEAYLDDGVRRNISQFNLVNPDAVTRGVGRLGADLADGTWDVRNGELRQLGELDLGYVVLVART